ncbi:hypothetical protein FHX37_0474 [Haloactinospora alba]|uniref:Uncharacterized protein n=1 Tax=Haloactinospora alba TaxID=405555 RepID=A0A543NFI3_9ACTN|nr:hypothetical protein [Haloactinospora alba]TQN30592.1 hypothetical protein FHX37_0474 [Haloactinospora alba]
MTSSQCIHDDACPVESSGVIVAWLCPDCDTQLGADFGKELQRRRDDAAFRAACTHTDVYDVTTHGDTRGRGVCTRCGQDMRETPAGGWEPT